MMKTKDSKAQLEVWAWKERLSKEILKLPENERVAYILEKAKKMVEELKKHNKNAA